MPTTLDRLIERALEEALQLAGTDDSDDFADLDDDDDLASMAFVIADNASRNTPTWAYDDIR